MRERYFPQQGWKREKVEEKLAAFKANDIDWKQGRSLRSIWHPIEIIDVLNKAFVMYISENALNKDAFPSVIEIEEEVVRMASEILGGNSEAVGNITTGGTESIFLAVKSARDYARAHKPFITKPNIVIPLSGHPAFSKAAYYMDLEVILVPTKNDGRADVNAVSEAINENTIMILGSAPEFSFGVMDPIEELGSLAVEKNVWMHVDACVGGYFAPFARKLGYPVPPFDLSVKGVISISADNHKMGLAHKPSSTVLYKSAEYYQYQGFKYDKWPRGLYNVPTFTGTRPAGPIAAAWAALKLLGEDGFVDQVDRVMKTRQSLMEGINNIPELMIISNPELCIFAFKSETIDLKAVARKLSDKKWYFGLNLNPTSIHFFLAPFHDMIVVDFLNDLQSAIREVKEGHGPEDGSSEEENNKSY